jgi:AraC-like DNA-binding protein
MAATARSLALSERSLRRHLAVEGTSYVEIQHSVLEAVAGDLLRHQGLTIQETAHAMGFADATTFHRAFKRWTGMTPTAFRNAAPLH